MNKTPETYLKPPSPCNCMNVRRASRAVTQFYDAILKPSGLTIAQVGLLRQIDLATELSITELAQLIRVDRTTLNRNLKPLQQAGLLTISAGKDSRVRLITLSESGKTALASGLALWDAAQQQLQDYLGEEDLGKFIQLMTRLEALVP